MLPATAALLVIDLQMAIDHPRWTTDGPRNNPQAEQVVAELLSAWRASGRPIFHIRHDSQDPGSTYYAQGPGRAFKREATPEAGEPIISKKVHSAFIGTDLEHQLRAIEANILVIVGVITNNSVEATVRTAADLGFDVRHVEDGCFTFASMDYSGHLRTADEVHAMSLANLDGEYCKVVQAKDVR